ncbi:MAG TPA: hypothetical protein PKZ78_03610, partial [Candidatus Goldiibacteriota bacterium]|nr:hypothetical protein [Candidatus Goldiibacteriota bacterium]
MYEAKKLGQILLEEGMVTEEQLEKAVEEQSKTNDSLGFILVKLGYITEDVLYHFLAMQFGVKFVDVSAIHIEEEVIKVLTQDTARKSKVIPIEKKPGKIIFATANPMDPSLTMNLKYEMKAGQDTEISFVVTTQSALNDAIEKYYPIGNALDDTMKELEGNIEIEFLEEKKAKEEEGEEGDIEGNDSPVVKYVN